MTPAKCLLEIIAGSLVRDEILKLPARLRVSMRDTVFEVEVEVQGTSIWQLVWLSHSSDEQSTAALTPRSHHHCIALAQ